MPPARLQDTSKSLRHNPVPNKSARQQNTACAPCRKRRVKCDRKDASADGSSPPICTECYQRSFNCVDDIKDTKPPKLLRRGRKIQELEVLYGRPDVYDIAPDPSIEQYAPPPPSAVPELTMEFFNSKFYRRFHIQLDSHLSGPIVDPNEFIDRYERWINKGVQLGTYGQLIAKLLATWAASYGVDESGNELPHVGLSSVERRRESTNIMARELLSLIDKFSVLRSVSWDGVRVLLLLLPLTEEIQPEAERASMYQSTVFQVYQLSKLGDLPASSSVGGAVNQLVRARIFWYGHVHEGLTNGLKGKKLVFDQDDVDAFRTPLTTGDYNQALARSNVTSSYTYRYATAPIRLSAACRLINQVLTGAKAERSETVDREGMEQVWGALANSWEEFEDLRELPLTGRVGSAEDTDRFVSGWHMFIFEACSIVKEKLAERIARIGGNISSNSGAFVVETNPSPSSQVALRNLIHLHDIAESKCHELADKVMALIRRHVNTTFFDYDASLCRDGVFYVGQLLASDPTKGEDVGICLRALEQMRWAFSKGQERTQRLSAIWDATLHEAERMRPTRLSLNIGLGVQLPKLPNINRSSYLKGSMSADAVHIKQSSSPTTSHFNLNLHGSRSPASSGSPLSNVEPPHLSGVYHNGAPFPPISSAASSYLGGHHPSSGAHQLYESDALDFTFGGSDYVPSSHYTLASSNPVGYSPSPPIHLPSLSPSSSTTHVHSPTGHVFPGNEPSVASSSAYALPQIQTTISSSPSTSSQVGYFDSVSSAHGHPQLPPLHELHPQYAASFHQQPIFDSRSYASSGSYYDALESAGVLPSSATSSSAPHSSSSYLPSSSLSHGHPYSSSASASFGTDLLSAYINTSGDSSSSAPATVVPRQIHPALHKSTGGDTAASSASSTPALLPSAVIGNGDHHSAAYSSSS